MIKENSKWLSVKTHAQIMSSRSIIYGLFLLLGFLLIALEPGSAFAQAKLRIDDLAGNIVQSTNQLPGLITAIAYLLGLMLAVSGILKLKDHVENPSQTKLQVAVARLLGGGALFALPYIYDVMQTTIAGDGLNYNIATHNTALSWLSGKFGSLISKVGGITGDANAIMTTIIESIKTLPGFITALTYLLGLLMGLSGILKIKDHVEDPDKNPLNEGVVRLLIGGAFFSLNAVISVLSHTLGELGWLNQASSFLGSLDLMSSAYDGGNNICNPMKNSMGGVLCNMLVRSSIAPAFINLIAYLMGIVLTVWGLLKIQDHVLNPNQTKVWEGVSRLLAAAACFALPVIVEVMRGTVTPISLSVLGLGDAVTGYNETKLACNNGLDGMLYCLMQDLLVPIHSILTFFAFIAGTLLILIGISRLIKGAQEGAKAPGGFGTIMTFIIGGALVSYNELMRGVTVTLFANSLGNISGKTLTYAKISYLEGSAEELMHATTVLSAILKFMIVIGLISFVRGLFIIRGVAEGNSQSSIMAGMTHIIGGALAVNLGSLINVVQATLGITDYGLQFGALS